jgi:hypothetical protein
MNRILPVSLSVKGQGAGFVGAAIHPGGLDAWRDAQHHSISRDPEVEIFQSF